jgi:DNA-binding NarL/FixJ family response regulator
VNADSPMGLLVSRDLFFNSKITGTARELGRMILVAGTSEQTLAMIDQWQPRVLLVDLAAGPPASTEAIIAYRKQAGPGVTFIAFGSHVDAQALEAASAAGCDVVLPRSKFSRDLPQLIEAHLGTGGAPTIP